MEGRRRRMVVPWDRKSVCRPGLTVEEPRAENRQFVIQCCCKEVYRWFVEYLEYVVGPHLGQGPLCFLEIPSGQGIRHYILLAG